MQRTIVRGGSSGVVTRRRRIGRRPTRCRRHQRGSCAAWAEGEARCISRWLRSSRCRRHQRPKASLGEAQSDGRSPSRWAKPTHAGEASPMGRSPIQLGRRPPSGLAPIKRSLFAEQKESAEGATLRRYGHRLVTVRSPGGDRRSPKVPPGAFGARRLRGGACYASSSPARRLRLRRNAVRGWGR